MTQQIDPEQAWVVAGRLTKAQQDLVCEGAHCVRTYKPAQRLVEFGIWSDRGDEYTIYPDWTETGKAWPRHLAGGRAVSGVEVTQADWEAAVELQQLIARMTGTLLVGDGVRDGFGAAFARRRLAATADLARERDALREALEEIKLICEEEPYKVVEGQRPCKHTASINEVYSVADAVLSREER